MVSRCESRCQGLGYGGVRFRLHVVIQDGPAPAVQAESTGPSCRSERGPVHGRPVDRRRASVSEGRWLCPNRGGCREGRHIPRRIRGPTVRDQQRLPGGRTSLALGTETSTIGEERRSSGVAHTTTSCFYVICHVRSKHSDAPATIRAALDRPAAARLAGQTESVLGQRPRGSNPAPSCATAEGHGCEWVHTADACSEGFRSRQDLGVLGSRQQWKAVYELADPVARSDQAGGVVVDGLRGGHIGQVLGVDTSLLSLCGHVSDEGVVCSCRFGSDS